MSRIEKIMRELSDLREFQIKLERRHVATTPKTTLPVAEDPASYYADVIHGQKERSS